MNNNNNLHKSFLIVFFYKLENELNSRQNGIETIKFQSEESNTDEHLKKYFQNYILNNNDLSGVNLKTLKVTGGLDDEVVSLESLSSYKITNVFLPEQITPDQKKSIADSKQSIYTSPDLYLEITNGNDIYYESVELKSTKDNNIPGSSVQQISPFEWVIFVKRDNAKAQVSTGFYINSITEKLPFPDRSPRPQISFKNLDEWNRKYRKIENETLVVQTFPEINNEKIKLLTDWQDFLAMEWLEIIKSQSVKNNEKWFNSAIRKFALKFLDYTNSLSDIEKEKLKTRLEKLIN